MSEHENAGGGNRCPNGHYLPAPGPSAEDALRWAYRDQHVEHDATWERGCAEFVARGLADLTRAPGGQDAE